MFYYLVCYPSDLLPAPQCTLLPPSTHLDIPPFTYPFIQLSSHPAIHTLCIFFLATHINFSVIMHLPIYPSHPHSINPTFHLFTHPCSNPTSQPVIPTLQLYPNPTPHSHPSIYTSLLAPHPSPACRRPTGIQLACLYPAQDSAQVFTAVPLTCSYIDSRYQSYNSLLVPRLLLQPGPCLLYHLTHNSAPLPLTWQTAIKHMTGVSVGL